MANHHVDRPSQPRALAVDKVDGNHIRAYVGVPGHGIEILELERPSSLLPWTFNSVTERIETPGDVHGLTLRSADPALGLPKSLLVGDSYAGLRIYGEEEQP
jgi:hypothetical protein